jgi:cholesterol transport system auxiliary component
MHYRLAYRNAAEIAAFAGSRWAATPPEMLRKQLLRAVVEGGAKCSLAVEIQEFSQVFASASQSAARVELRVVLAAGARSMARGISVVEEQAGADAPGGAAALARAVNRAIGELGGWIGAQPDCR